MDQRGFYRPQDAWVGDVIPWEEDGRFHLFYLHETRRTPKEGMPWHRVVTDDLIRFEETGTSLASGGPSAQDFNATPAASWWTATARTMCSTPVRTPTVAVRTASRCRSSCTPPSRDGMASWQRHPDDTFGATAGYETADWRDPFVFWDDEAALWRMLVTARHDTGPARRRGVIAQCTSRDLRTWEPARALLGSAPVHRARVPRGLRVERLVVPLLLRVQRVLHHPLPDVAQPARAVARARERHARRTRLLRGQIRGPRRPPVLLRMDRLEGRRHR